MTHVPSARPARRRAGLLSLVPLCAAPAAARAQWRAGATMEPAPGLETRAGQLAGYASLIGGAAERLREAMRELERHGARSSGRPVVPPQRQALMDQAQRAWLAVKEAPDELRGREVFLAAERQFAEAVGRMARAEISLGEAIRAARGLLAAKGRLHAAATAARPRLHKVRASFRSRVRIGRAQPSVTNEFPRPFPALQPRRCSTPSKGSTNFSNSGQCGMIFSCSILHGRQNFPISRE